MSRPRPAAIVLTCEHASARVPAALKVRFAGCRAVLASHRGSDLGALPVARRMAAALGAPLFAGRVSRLVVDLNRSPGRRGLFSEFTRTLDSPTRAILLDRYHRPHWEAVEAALRAGMRRRGRVIHLGVHSFTPVLDGQVRRVDVGLLYDPRRPVEVSLAGALADALGEVHPGLMVRSNQPYRGVTDGLTTALRRLLPSDRYVGLELELNQALVTPGAGSRRGPAVAKGIVTTLAAVLRTFIGPWPTPARGAARSRRSSRH